MAIWLGSGGGLRLKRKASPDIYVHVDVADVDVSARRLSAERAIGALITGDYVAVDHVDDDGNLLVTPLEFLPGSAWPDGQRYPDGQWYVNVDSLGGVRLYEKWSDAIEGRLEAAVQLQEPAVRSRIRMALVEQDERCVGQTVSWTLDTERETADITPLGEGFRQNQSVLVSGTGTIDCLFDAFTDECVGYSDREKSIYFHRLVLRQEIGSEFVGVFLLKRESTLPIGLDPSARTLELFYLCDCVITNVLSQINTEDVVHSKIEFVTTGKIQLLYNYPTDYLLQEEPADQYKVLQESDFGIVMESLA